MKKNIKEVTEKWVFKNIKSYSIIHINEKNKIVKFKIKYKTINRNNVKEMLKINYV